MNAENQNPDRLSVAIQNDTGYVHVVGRGSFKVSTGLKQFGVASIERGCRQIVLDMAECSGMDSTFMGVLAGLAFRLKRNGAGELHLVNLSERTRGSLETLGLNQVVNTNMAGSTPEEFREVVEADFSTEEIAPGEESRQSRAETMLEAHENLVDLTPKNRPKFEDVLTFLREDVQKEQGDGSGTAS